MISTLKTVWSLLTPRERGRALLMLSLVILMAFVETAGVLSIMPFLAVLSRPEIINEKPWLHALFESSGLSDQRSFIVALGIGSIAIVIGSSLFKTVTQHALNRFVHFLRHSISSRLLEAYLGQPYEFFLSRNTSELNKNLLSETDQFLFGLIQPAVQLVAQGMVVLAMVLVVIVYDPWVAAGIITVVGSLYAMIYWLVRKRLVRIGTERMAANRDRYQASSEVLSGIKDVKVTQSGSAYLKRFNRASREYSRHMATSDTLGQTPLYLVEATGYSVLILIALLLLLRSDEIAQVLPALGLYGFAAYRMLPAAQIMYRGVAKLKFSSPALTMIHRDLNLSKENMSTTDDLLIPRREIRLENIRFSYPSAPEQPVFEGLELVIPANTSIGIMGPSGSGKSTLMDLLLGLQQPQSGTLLVDGARIDSTNASNWQRSIGYVPQHIFLSDASVAENIAFGVPADQIDMESVKRSARAAQIHTFIEKDLPHGYHTPIGERGVRLSGGQRQRIGVARALYRDPPVLLLDEATSALDSGTEKSLICEIMMFSKRARAKTIVIISHNPTSLSQCDKRIILQTDADQHSSS